MGSDPRSFLETSSLWGGHQISIMERHGCKWFLLLLCLSRSLGATVPSVTSFEECDTECPTDDCKSQIILCLKKISVEATGIRDTIFSSTEIKELVKSMKTSVMKIYGSSRDMIRKMRAKGEASLLTDEEKDGKFKSEANLKEIKGTARDILYTKDKMTKDKMFELLIPLIEKVDNENDRLSQPTASTESGTVPDPAVPADGKCDKCSPKCLQDILSSIKTQFTDMAKLKTDDKLTGDDLFKKLEGVVNSLEDKKIELEIKKSKEGNDLITKNCYQGHIKTLRDLYVKSEQIYVDMRKLSTAERQSLTLADHFKLARLAEEVTDLLGQAPSTPGCVLGKLEATIKEMNKFQERLEGENAEDPRVNTAIGKDLYDSVDKIAADKKNAADGDCDDSWGKFFQENLRSATFEVADSSKTGNIRKYQISQTNLEKALAKHITLLKKLKSVEEKKASSGGSNEVKTKVVDVNECNQKEYKQSKSYIDKLDTLDLDTFATKNDDTAVKDDAKTTTTIIKDIIHDLETRESSLRRNGGNQCQDETKYIGIYRTDLDKCKDGFKSPSKREDFTVLKTCIEKVEDKIKKRRNDLTRTEIKNKFAK